MPLCDNNLCKFLLELCFITLHCILKHSNILHYCNNHVEKKHNVEVYTEECVQIKQL